MKEKDNLAGKRFGKLTVLSIDTSHPYKRRYWKCICDCGNTTTVRASHLKDGTIKGCGCMAKEVHTVHGRRKTRLYSTWCNMKSRCLNPNNKRYDKYGGRGIRVCDEWVKSFVSFSDWADNNGYRDDLTIERINVNGNYSPENCTWIPFGEQTKNTTRNIVLTFNGETKIASEWATEYNIPKNAFWARIRSGWDIERALTEPVKKGGSNG